MIASPIVDYLISLHQRYRDYDKGKVADYIPELSKANPDWFGLAVSTRDGNIYEVGDTQQLFTIQSISKALAYGIALEDIGESRLLRKIGVEPSGEAFNAISLKPESGAPFNPMINAGAIAVCGQIAGTTTEEKIGRILDVFSRCAGRPLGIDETVYRSESETGHRNRAIGWMLRNFGILQDEPTATLETYFQQCSIQVTARDLAVMGATLCNDGVNPLTGLRALDSRVVPSVLSVMSTCGMYDYAGEWLFRVGLPAKSGVGGGIMAVLPSQLGIGVFSPCLDEHGNSARGIQVCTDLSRDLSLHLCNNSVLPRSSIRLIYDGASVHSKRRQRPESLGILKKQGHRLQVLELQAELRFSSVEPLIRTIVEQLPHRDYFIISMRYVSSMDTASARLLGQLFGRLTGLKKSLAISNCKSLITTLIEAGIDRESIFETDDLAIEYFETELLKRFGTSTDPNAMAAMPVALKDCMLFEDFTENELKAVEKGNDRKHFKGGEKIIVTGDDADSLYVLLQGSVQIELPLPDGTIKRQSVFSAGMSFGEMAFIDRSVRSADVVTLEPSECLILSRQHVDQLSRISPSAKEKLLTNVARILSANLRQANIELSAIHG
jgi:glutaminase